MIRARNSAPYTAKSLAGAPKVATLKHFRDPDKEAPDDGPRKFSHAAPQSCGNPFDARLHTHKRETMEEAQPERMPLAPASAPVRKKVKEITRSESTPNAGGLDFSATARMPARFLSSG